MSSLPDKHIEYPVFSSKDTDSLKPDDLQLWESFRKGSETAFIEIYNNYYQVLYDYGYNLTSNNVICKDCIHDLFLKLRENRSVLPKVESVIAYLIKSIRNQILNELKRNKRSVHLEGQLEFQPFLILPSHETVIINRQFSQIQLKKISEAVADLSERQREAIHLFYYDGLRYNEIADVMGFASTRAARNLIYRSLKSIRETIKY